MVQNRATVVTLFGSSGGGKSLLSAALGNEFTANKNRVCVISFDLLSQSLRCFLPFEKIDGSRSVGRLLSGTRVVTEKDVLESMAFHPNNKDLGFLGMCEADTILSWGRLDAQKLFDLLQIVVKICDFVIIDAGANPIEDAITASAIEFADFVFRVISADLKGIAYEKAVIPTLTPSRYKIGQQNLVLNGVMYYTPTAEVKNILGSTVDFEIPYSEEARRKYDEGEIIKSFSKREGIAFGKAIAAIARKVAADSGI